MARLDQAILAGGALWIVGCGNMGRAMLDRWIVCGLDLARVTVVDPAMPVIGQGVVVLAAPDPHAPPPSVVLLAVKPQLLDKVAVSIAPLLGTKTLLVSILAGVRIEALRTRFAAPADIARAMPNLPVAIGAGVVALYGVSGQPAAARFEALMAPLGAVEWLDAEAQFDAVTALSGSGPAFVARFIDALATGGAALGLPEAQAARMALATISGTAALLDSNGETPAAMAKRVTSPNGTTQAGLAALDEGGVFAARVAATLEAAALRSAELAAVSANPPSEAQ
jgi:pyrroline-5-carboxylate reductase